MKGSTQRKANSATKHNTLYIFLLAIAQVHQELLSCSGSHQSRGFNNKDDQHDDES